MSKCVAAGRHHSEAKGISMFIIYIIVTIVTVAANVFAAVVDFRHPQWVVDNITRWGESQSLAVHAWRPQGRGRAWTHDRHRRSSSRRCSCDWLVLFFLGAIVVVTRARWYSHLPWPATYLFLAVASLVLRLAV